ncbi:TetR/AcrR family transcriptional regulator [Bacillus sonorensis]|nr:TetR/AcrR family transcriptional regulator [Bacillus sonorensis]
MESKTNAKRQLILNTAKHIILDHDFNALTLDAVAKQVSISKGGLLYHFPNKEALIKGLALFVFEEMNATFEKTLRPIQLRRGNGPAH